MKMQHKYYFIIYGDHILDEKMPFKPKFMIVKDVSKTFPNI